MLEYAAKLAREPWAMSQEDVEGLRNAGFSDPAILGINLAASYMSFVNRVAEGLGVELEEDFSDFTR
jgi:alkylhydroperoxidase family enzyme